ncbi:MAG TPA: branched-chain amino acid transaminase [Thermomicrobiales bacterium]|nr:branched-chain amino acid transaminase [Thermomicrobiales bacterium]
MAGHPKYLWWNGKQVAWEDAMVHVSDIAWSATGAVFEGIRAYWNDEREELFVFRLREHMQRLKDSSKMVRLPIQESVDDLVGITIDLLRANECREDTYVFPLVYFGEARTKRADPGSLHGDLYITTDSRPSHLGTGMTQRAKVSSWNRISDNVMPPRVKNISNYRNGQLATYEVKQDGYDVALLLGPDAKVTESSGACVMFVKNGKLITPDPASGILESITRDALMTLAREELGIPVIERRVDRTELYTADEVFLCGTMAEITPIVEVDRYAVGDGGIGPVTAALEDRFINIVRGNEATRADWRTPVGIGSGVV